MKKEIKPFSWTVVNFDSNIQTIVRYDVLGCREGFIKRLKKNFL
jgi:hypothetical protein